MKQRFGGRVRCLSMLMSAHMALEYAKHCACEHRTASLCLSGALHNCNTPDLIECLGRLSHKRMRTRDIERLRALLTSDAVLVIQY